MPRTVVPIHRYSSSPSHRRGARDETGDDYKERLVKYVPAETLAFVVPAAAMAAGRDWLIAVVLIAGGLGNLSYLWLAGEKAPANQKPAGLFYLLAVIAYLGWAVGTCAPVQDFISVDQTTAGVVLLVVAFVVPLVDDVTGSWIKRRANR